MVGHFAYLLQILEIFKFEKDPINFNRKININFRWAYKLSPWSTKPDNQGHLKWVHRNVYLKACLKKLLFLLYITCVLCWYRHRCPWPTQASRTSEAARVSNFSDAPLFCKENTITCLSTIVKKETNENANTWSSCSTWYSNSSAFISFVVIIYQQFEKAKLL